MSYAPFPINEDLTAVTLAYTNEAMIADSIMPRTPVGKQEFNYYAYDKRDRMTVPNTHVGRKSMPNEVSFGAEEHTAATQDYGLDDIIPRRDMENADERHDPRNYAVESISELLELDREQRVCDLVFDTATYPEDRREELSESDRWDDPDSKPLDQLMDALDAPLMRPNVLVLGQRAWTHLSRHPQLVKAMHGTSGDAGRITRDFLADLLEISEVQVGAAWHNTASNPSREPDIRRLWGPHASLIYRNPAATNRGGVTFGLSFQFGDRVAGDIEEPKIGLRGSVRVRVGWSLAEKVLAPDVGYHFHNVINGS